MSAAEQSLAEFQAVLEKHRANEATYKDRLKDINLTRGKIADQLEVLQQTYDKKLKGLEQKLETIKGQNDSLVRENALYKSEIETYQSRLLEKEKIIAALLSQRKDLLVVSS
jgi:chromosome segregation ATPase